MIVDYTDIQDFNVWITSTLKHEFLEFTYNFNPMSIDFLDIRIMLDDNNKLSTTLYSKPMSKHQFVH